MKKILSIAVIIAAMLPVAAIAADLAYGDADKAFLPEILEAVKDAGSISFENASWATSFENNMNAVIAAMGAEQWPSAISYAGNLADDCAYISNANDKTLALSIVDAIIDVCGTSGDVLTDEDFISSCLTKFYTDDYAEVDMSQWHASGCETIFYRKYRLYFHLQGCEYLPFLSLN